MDPLRRHLCRAAALALLGVRPAAATAPTLRLGVMPVYGGHALIRRYEPMRRYVADLLDQPVRVESARDFRRFLASILAGEFDLAVAAAHFARIAQLDAGWRPIVQFKPDHDTMLITRAGAAPRALADLAGQEVAVVDDLAITVVGALRYLALQGLTKDRDYRVTEYHNHASVVHSLLSGASAMAVTTSHGLKQIPPEQRARIEIYRRLPDTPAFVVIAAPGTARPTLDKLRSGLQAFTRSAAGREFLSLNSYTDLIPADEAAMRRADPFIKTFRTMLAR